MGAQATRTRSVISKFPIYDSAFRLYHPAHDSSAAASHYRAALDAEPTRPEIHAGLALALLDCGQPAEARAAALRAVELEPENGGTHYILGRILRLGGDKDQALAAFDKAVALDPSHYMALCQEGGITVGIASRPLRR